MAKVIASTGDRFLVEMSASEIAVVAGYRGARDYQWQAIFRGGEPPIGATIDVAAAYTFHARISENQDVARKSAGTLRALADLLDGAMPDVALPPAAEEAKEGGHDV
ncbi:MAG: hypothetical protein EA385_15265 [Salinarimonadaceae bacterium]|nr:MAG: hypothetical protein EA385_15265 [Salinarimonadaceae bacterium]